jgi:hypothetical protein
VDHPVDHPEDHQEDRPEDRPTAVNTQGVSRAAPPEGSVLLVVVQERTTKAGKPYWAVTDSNGEFYFVFEKMKNSDDEWVDGKGVAAIAMDVAARGEPVVLTTAESKTGHRSIVGIHRRGDDEGTIDDTPDDATPDDDTPDDQDAMALLQEDDIPF